MHSEEKLKSSDIILYVLGELKRGLEILSPA